MNKILFIIGPTGTGKTAFALKLAKEFNGDLVSADSRQVYKEMDIGTGKDIPKEFRVKNYELRIKERKKKIIYYTDGKTRIWGLDLVEPNEEFSVAEFVRFAVPVIQQIWLDRKLPIIVGGTGLYIHALIRDLPEIFIPQNKKLRQKLYSLSVSKLQKSLAQLNITKFNSMNKSDQSNPRRLVRAIEIEEWKKKQDAKNVILGMSEATTPESPSAKLSTSGFWTNQNDKLIIGLTASKEVLNYRIDQRVEKRITQGIIQEIQLLLAKGYTWELPSFSALGYDIWEDYFIKSAQISETEQKKLKKEIIQKWKLSEQQYAKRQLTWFKKEQGINWFDINNPDYVKRMLQRVEKWYNQKSSV